MKKQLAKYLLDSHKRQSEKKYKDLQKKNFFGKKAITQWWYFDVFTEDGTILVIAFIPKMWWLENILSVMEDSYLLVGLTNREGIQKEIKISLDSCRITYTPNSLSYEDKLFIEYIENEKPSYNLTINLPEVKTSLKIVPSSPPFSPIPRGYITGLERVVFLQKKWIPSDFRYVSMVPRAEVYGHLALPENTWEIKGHGYHEQGWFDDYLHHLCDGWVWYHFLHPQVNVFFNDVASIYLQKDGKTIIGGPNIYEKDPQIFEIINYQKEKRDSQELYTACHIRYNLSPVKFEIITQEEGEPKELILYKSHDNTKFWSTCVVKAKCILEINAKQTSVYGDLIIESCKC